MSMSYHMHCSLNAPLAQLVEHLTLNQGVEGSSPSRRIGSFGFADMPQGRSFFVRFFPVKGMTYPENGKIRWFRLSTGF